MDQESTSWADLVSMLVSITSDSSQSLKNQQLARHQLIKIGERMDILSGWFTEKNIEFNDPENGLFRLHDFLMNESRESTSNNPPS